MKDKCILEKCVSCSIGEGGIFYCRDGKIITFGCSCEYDYLYELNKTNIFRYLERE